MLINDIMNKQSQQTPYDVALIKNDIVKSDPWRKEKIERKYLSFTELTIIITLLVEMNTNAFIIDSLYTTIYIGYSILLGWFCV